MFMWAKLTAPKRLVCDIHEGSVYMCCRVFCYTYPQDHVGRQSILNATHVVDQSIGTLIVEDLHRPVSFHFVA